jgi:hypothetical protein
MTSGPESVEPLWVAGAASGGAGPCPEASEVAGFAEGRLSDTEAERIAAHAAGCAACRTAIVAVSEATEGETVARAPPPRGRLRLLPAPLAIAVAATLLVAVGVGAFLLSRRDERPPASADERLVAAARDLAAAEPSLFRDFVPLTAAERAARDDGRERGGLRLLSPTDVVLSQRPTFRWGEVPGAESYQVTLQGGDELWKRTAESGPFLSFPTDRPALAPGRYTWTVATEGVLGGRTEGRRTFTVASRDEAEALARAQRTIADRAPEDVALLLAAHWALRRGFVEEAERLAREHVAQHPASAPGVETLRMILHRRGTPGEGGGAPR